MDDAEGLEDGGAVALDGDSRELYCVFTVNSVSANVLKTMCYFFLLRHSLCTYKCTHVQHRTLAPL